MILHSNNQSYVFVTSVLGGQTLVHDHVSISKLEKALVRVLNNNQNKSDVWINDLSSVWMFFYLFPTETSWRRSLMDHEGLCMLHFLHFYMMTNVNKHFYFCNFSHVLPKYFVASQYCICWKRLFRPIRPLWFWIKLLAVTNWKHSAAVSLNGEVFLFNLVRVRPLTVPEVRGHLLSHCDVLHCLSSLCSTHLCVIQVNWVKVTSSLDTFVCL